MIINVNPVNAFAIASGIVSLRSEKLNSISGASFIAGFVAYAKAPKAMRFDVQTEFTALIDQAAFVSAFALPYLGVVVSDITMKRAPWLVVA